MMRGIVGETELASDPLRELLGLQEAILSLIKFLIGDAGVALDAVDVDHPVGIARDLQPRGGLIFAGHQRG